MLRNSTTQRDVTLTSGGEFFFPFREMQMSSPRTSLFAFSGRVRINAHFGMLLVDLNSPRVIVESGNATLSARAGDVAHVVLGPARFDEGVTMWRSEGVSLAASAVPTFGGVYPTGTSMAPLTIRVPRTGV